MSDHKLGMTKQRLEAFSDGVLAIIITIMVLELKVPHGEELSNLSPLLPVFLSYVLSFIYVGIYWNNHHHMMHLCEKVTGPILWSNLHLLFWLSLIPFVTGWLGENHFAAMPALFYGFVLFMSALACWILQQSIIHSQGANSTLQRAVGRDWKGKLSPFLYVGGMASSFWSSHLSMVFYVISAVIWIVPDPRIERVNLSP